MEAGTTRIGWIVVALCLVGPGIAPTDSYAQLLEQFDTPQRATPYRATVRRSKIDVFSGPGGQYYRTSVLTEGAEVEVHHVMGGFLGIRPPEGSFSWAPGDDVQEIEPGVGEVAREGVPSRVGSLLTEERNVVHVRLKQGERVRVLSRMMIDGAEWAQIAPPAGEFRWIRATDVSSKSGDQLQPLATTPAAATPFVEPPLVVEATPTVNALTPRQAASQWVTAATQHRTPIASTSIANDPPTNGGWVTQTAATAATPPASPPTTSTQPQQQTPVAHQTPAAQSTTAIANRSDALGTPVASTSGPFAKQLAALEVELSRRVSEAPHLWRLEGIAIAATRLQSTTRDPQELAAARAFANRVDRFTAIASRHQQLASLTPQASIATSSVVPPPTVSTTITPIPGVTPGATPTAAAQPIVGELRAVVSKRADAPKFALLNEQGKVATFVTPQPGMDLQPLVGKQVEVTGVRAYLPAIRSQHVTASRVAQTQTATATPRLLR